MRCSAHGACHILQAEGVKAHLDQGIAHFDILVDGVNRALGVADTAAGDGTGSRIFLGSHQGGFKVAEIVQGIENTDDINTVLDTELNEFLNDVIMIVLVSQKVLATEQHLKTRIGHVLADVPQSFPRILSQISEAGVKGGAAPALDRVIPGFVHRGEDFLEIRVRQTGSHQRLICIAHYRFGKLYFSHELISYRIWIKSDSNLFYYNRKVTL